MATSGVRTRLAVAVVGAVIVLGAASWIASSKANKPPRERRGIITKVDYASRRGSLKFVHPKTNDSIEVEGEITPDCAIEIDGKPGQITDVRVGDNAVVRVSVRSGSVIVSGLKISRAPATQPAAARAPAADTSVVKR